MDKPFLAFDAEMIEFFFLIFRFFFLNVVMQVLQQMALQFLGNYESQLAKLTNMLFLFGRKDMHFQVGFQTRFGVERGLAILAHVHRLAILAVNNMFVESVFCTACSITDRTLKVLAVLMTFNMVHIATMLHEYFTTRLTGEGWRWFGIRNIRIGYRNFILILGILTFHLIFVEPPVLQVIPRVSEGLAAIIANMGVLVCLCHVPDLDAAYLEESGIAGLADAGQFPRVSEFPHLKAVDMKEAFLARLTVRRYDVI